VVLATGGLGALYRYTTNPGGQWGAGIAIAARAGALLADLEFVQFHPTALNAGIDPMPLVTEAIRGEGALLVDAQGRRIMEGDDPRGELAPRDVVARAVYRAAIGGTPVYLDARSLAAGFPQKFPAVFEACGRAGIDPRVMPIPVAPAAHYHMGGAAVDATGKTTVPGLWACGEVSATGVHGANRLASNSLLEALVFARWVARDLAASHARAARHVAPSLKDELPYTTWEDAHEIGSVRERMFRDVGIVRTGTALEAARAAFSELARRAPSARLRDMALVAALVAQAASLRHESRGSHFRADHPQTSAVARRSFTQPDALLSLVAA